MSDSGIRYDLDPDHQLTGDEKRMLDEAEASVSRAPAEAGAISVTLSREAMEAAERLGLLRPPCDSLTLPSSGRVRDFHPIVNAHAEHTRKAPGRPARPEAFCVHSALGSAGYFPSCSTVLSIPAIISVLMAFSTQRIMTPTSAKMANHMLAMPIAPRIRHRTLMKMAKTMFS